MGRKKIDRDAAKMKRSPWSGVPFWRDFCGGGEYLDVVAAFGKRNAQFDARDRGAAVFGAQGGYHMQNSHWEKAVNVIEPHSENGNLMSVQSEKIDL
jgi:hypothetical protein